MERPDTLDGIVADVERLYPGIEVTGLPITGRIMRMSRYLEGMRETELGRFGLTIADFDVLATMRRRAGNGSINIRELQQATMLSSGGTTKRLDRLENAGLLERHPDPNDRRGTLISLSRKALKLIDAVIPAITLMESEYIRRVLTTGKERACMADGLRALLLSQETE